MQQNHTMFNLALSQARVSIEKAFGVLKGRWRLLLGKVNLEPSFASDVVIACTVLHNICQDCHEPLEDVLEPNILEEQAEIQESTQSPDKIREMLVDYVFEHTYNDPFN